MIEYDAVCIVGYDALLLVQQLRYDVHRQLLALHRTTVLRHDEYGQETVLNLLLRNYLHYNLYDQVKLMNAVLCLHPNSSNSFNSLIIEQNASLSNLPHQDGKVFVFRKVKRNMYHSIDLQAEKLRSRAQKLEVWRSTQQLCRYLFYLGRIRAVQLDYTDSKDCLQQAVRKASSLEASHTLRRMSPRF